MTRFKQVLGTLLGVLLTGAAQAVALGPIQIESYLSQPLQASVPVLGIPADETDMLRISVAPRSYFAEFDLPESPELRFLDFAVRITPADDVYIDITSDELIKEPYLALPLQVRWASGVVVRQYLMLLDPDPVMTRLALARSDRAASERAAPAARAMKSQPPRSVGTAVSPPTGAVRAAVEPAGSPAVPSAYGPVKPRETLWEIAEALAPPEVRTEQMMMALLAANPDAFYGGNVNNLKAGSRLRVPPPAAVAARELAADLSALQDQNKAWRQRGAGAGPAPMGEGPRVGRMRILPPDTASLPDWQVTPNPVAAAPGMGSRGAGGALAGLDRPLRLTLADELSTGRQAQAVVREQMVRLAEDLQRMQRILELKQQQLGLLQSAIDDSEPARPPAVRPSPPITRQRPVLEPAPEPEPSPPAAATESPAVATADSATGAASAPTPVIEPAAPAPAAPPESPPQPAPAPAQTPPAAPAAPATVAAQPVSPPSPETAAAPPAAPLQPMIRLGDEAAGPTGADSSAAMIPARTAPAMTSPTWVELTLLALAGVVVVLLVVILLLQWRRSRVAAAPQIDDDPALDDLPEMDATTAPASISEAPPASRAAPQAPPQQPSPWAAAAAAQSSPQPPKVSPLTPPLPAESTPLPEQDVDELYSVWAKGLPESVERQATAESAPAMPPTGAAGGADASDSEPGGLADVLSFDAHARPAQREADSPVTPSAPAETAPAPEPLLDLDLELPDEAAPAAAETDAPADDVMPLQLDPAEMADPPVTDMPLELPPDDAPIAEQPFEVAAQADEPLDMVGVDEPLAPEPAAMTDGVQTPAGSGVADVATTESQLADGGDLRLDLAKAYLEIGDDIGAREILQQVIDEGRGGKAMDIARQLLAELSD